MFGWEAGIRNRWQRADGELPRFPQALPSSHERAQQAKWLGGRDSNPDNGVQSAVSYR